MQQRMDASKAKQYAGAWRAFKVGLTQYPLNPDNKLASFCSLPGDISLATVSRGLHLLV